MYEYIVGIRLSFHNSSAFVQPLCALLLEASMLDINNNNILEDIARKNSDNETEDLLQTIKL